MRVEWVIVIDQYGSEHRVLSASFVGGDRILETYHVFSDGAGQQQVRRTGEINRADIRAFRPVREEDRHD